MVDVLTRKCAKCKGEIEIDVNNIRDVVYFDKSYYHKNCFKELAQQKASNKRCSVKWQEALSDDLKQVSKNANYIVNYCYGRDLLFEHLLNSYDICAISSYIKMALDNVVVGKYKGKSKPIPYRELAECWIAIHSELNKIYANNKRLGKSMTGDQRINYDLAVVVRMYPQWKKNHEKKKVEQDEQKKIIQSIRAQSAIDYMSLGKQTNHSSETDIDDMNSLLDAIF